MTTRDFNVHPYTAQEQRVCDYLTSLSDDMGCGGDPIGFLIASHAAVIQSRRSAGSDHAKADGGLLPTASEASMNKKDPMCECPKCGRTHRDLQAGKPPSAISGASLLREAVTLKAQPLVAPVGSAPPVNEGGSTEDHEQERG